jgi:hypothetical protein
VVPQHPDSVHGIVDEPVQGGGKVKLSESEFVPISVKRALDHRQKVTDGDLLGCLGPGHQIFCASESSPV